MKTEREAKSADAFLEELQTDLVRGIEGLKGSPFYRDLTEGGDVSALYISYLREAYHFVRLTSSFTPLAARRMDAEHIKLRRWILTHSAEELGHELMAMNDLHILGFDKSDIAAREPLPGTIAWVSFFHYHVAMEHPFAAMGVLYFLEGMAADLAPIAVKHVLGALGPNEKRAVTFFREHGALDVDHLSEQRDLLRVEARSVEEQEAVLRTVRRAAHVMRFFLDSLAKAA